MKPRRVCYLLFVIGIVILVGCSSGARVRRDVSGKVTYDGQPVPFGVIYFEPDRGNEGPQGVAEIRDGQYQTKPGFGAVYGSQSVRISGYSAEGSEAPLFPEYETQTQITEVDKPIDFEVPKGGKKAKAKQ